MTQAVRTLFEGFTGRSGLARAILSFLIWLADRSMTGTVDVHSSPGFVDIIVTPASPKFLPVLEGMLGDCLDREGMSNLKYSVKEPTTVQIAIRQERIEPEDLDFLQILAHEMKVAASEGKTLIEDVEDLKGIVEWKDPPK